MDAVDFRTGCLSITVFLRWYDESFIADAAKVPFSFGWLALSSSPEGWI